MRRPVWRLLLAPVLGASLLVACAAPSSSPQALRRLPPAELAAIEAAQRAGPLSLDDIVRRSREGVAAAALVDEIRRTGTHHALVPADVQRLRGQGVAQEVLDALAEAQSRWARDQATAEKVSRATAQAAAEDRARAEEARRQRAAFPYNSPYNSPFYDPMLPYGYPYGYPGRFGYGGFGWGVHIRR